LPEQISHSHKTEFDTSNLRVANEAELWTVLSRLLTFEEPADRSQQIRKAVRKHIDKKAPFDSLPLSEQGQIFSKIFGCGSDDDDRTESAAINALINFVLAYEDLCRFNTLAFDSWLKSEWQNEAIEQNRFLPDIKLTAAERLWLYNSTISFPNWSKLSEVGPWSDHPQARIISMFANTARWAILHENDSKFADAGRAKSSGNDGNSHSRDSLNNKFFEHGLTLWRKLVEENRPWLPGSFLPQIIVLAEGQTEVLMMPTFAKLMNTSFDELGIQLEACGGAKQVVKQYLNLKELTTLPIICILDADVSESAEIIQDSLRSIDHMVTVTQGEIEDTFSTPVLHRLINLYLKENGCLEPIPYIELVNNDSNRNDTLDRLFRIRGLGNFDKIGFAEIVAGNLKKSDVPEDGKRIIKAIVETYNAGSKLRFQ
jgi:hypothetical protein